MFRPRHAYRSPITNRYRGNAKGCPVFNTLAEVDYHLVEQHDECLECLLKINNSSDLETSSTTSWSSSCNSPPSPKSNSSISSTSQHHHPNTTHAHHNHHHHNHHHHHHHHHHNNNNLTRAPSSCSSTSPSPTPSPSPISSSPDLVTELRRPRLKLSDQKIRKIKKRPISFDDHYYSIEHSFASTPTTSSGCSPGQHSSTTQNSEQSRSGSLLSTNSSGSSSTNTVIHMFQAPARFVNYLKPCNLPTKPQEPKPKPTSTPPVPNKEMLNCAICGIKDRPPNISKTYGQNSCLLCSRFFASFLKRPQQLYCAQDGDCLMTFDSRCQACWIKVCLQKFDIEDEHRKIGQKYSPKLLSSPKVSLITIDTSLSR